MKVSITRDEKAIPHAIVTKNFFVVFGNMEKLDLLLVSLQEKILYTDGITFSFWWILLAYVKEPCPLYFLPTILYQKRCSPDMGFSCQEEVLNLVPCIDGSLLGQPFSVELDLNKVPITIHRAFEQSDLN